MKERAEFIRKVLKSIHKTSYRIKSVDNNISKFKRMNKSSFKKIIMYLKQIEERRDFMEAEIGLDMTVYEDKFFTIIEDLLKIVFNKAQLALIHMYIYQLIPDKEWNGKITVTIDKVEKEVDFKTSEQVWSVIKELTELAGMV